MEKICIRSAVADLRKICGDTDSSHHGGTRKVPLMASIPARPPSAVLFQHHKFCCARFLAASLRATIHELLASLQVSTEEAEAIVPLIQLYQLLENGPPTNGPIEAQHLAGIRGDLYVMIGQAGGTSAIVTAMKIYERGAATLMHAVGIVRHLANNFPCAHEVVLCDAVPAITRGMELHPSTRSVQEESVYALRNLCFHQPDVVALAIPSIVRAVDAFPDADEIQQRYNRCRPTF